MSQLIGAIKRGNINTIYELKKLGYNLNVTEDGKSALMYACDKCNYDNECNKIKKIRN